MTTPLPISLWAYCRDFFYKPKWKKEAYLLWKGGKKFLNYKRDLMEEEKALEIKSRRDDLIKAMRLNDKEGAIEAGKQLRATCENSLKSYRPQTGLEENVEVFFVAIVIALGIRAYYLQPFRIPTGSMQPTLNGVTGTPLERDKWPSAPVRLVEKVLRGRTYFELKVDQSKGLREKAPVVERPFFHFFTRTIINFDDGSKKKLSGTRSACMEAGLEKAFLYQEPRENGFSTKEVGNNPYDVYYRKYNRYNGVYYRSRFKAGEVLASGYVDTGDMVLVDKFSYHFRKPKRGEVFVFNTAGIKGIEGRSSMKNQQGATHYIKRLAGVPGDELSIDEPDLYINGKLAKEKGFKKVMSRENGYGGYVNPSLRQAPYLHSPDSIFQLRSEEDGGLNEYFALGDNNAYSLDSRYWGTVKTSNLVGPGLFSLWPFTTGHWGLIK